MATQTIAVVQLDAEMNYPYQWAVKDADTGQVVAHEGDGSGWSVAPADGNEQSPAKVIVWYPDQGSVGNYTAIWRGWATMGVYYHLFEGGLVVGPA